MAPVTEMGSKGLFWVIFLLCPEAFSSWGRERGHENFQVHFLWLKANINHFKYYYFNDFCKHISYTLSWTRFAFSNLLFSWLWDAKCCTVLGSREAEQPLYGRKESGKRFYKVSYSQLFRKAGSALLNQSQHYLPEVFWKTKQQALNLQCQSLIFNTSAMNNSFSLPFTVCSPRWAGQQWTPLQQQFSGVWDFQVG